MLSPVSVSVYHILIQSTVRYNIYFLIYLTMGEKNLYKILDHTFGNGVRQIKQIKGVTWIAWVVQNS